MVSPPPHAACVRGSSWISKCLSAAFNFRCYMCFCVVIHTERENKLIRCCDSLVSAGAILPILLGGDSIR